jgi:hypothetical protein
MLKLFEAMMHDWAVIRQGGWTFAMIVAVAFGAGLGVAAWHYGERLETERVRLAGKDESQIACRSVSLAAFFIATHCARDRDGHGCGRPGEARETVA